MPPRLPGAWAPEVFVWSSTGSGVGVSVTGFRTNLSSDESPNELYIVRITVIIYIYIIYLHTNISVRKCTKGKVNPAPRTACCLRTAACGLPRDGLTKQNCLAHFRCGIFRCQVCGFQVVHEVETPASGQSLSSSLRVVVRHAVTS